MTASILDGKAISLSIRNDLKAKVERMERPPKLVTIITVDNQSIMAYVKNKDRICKDIGIKTENIFLPDDAAFEDLIKLIEKANNDNDVDGILLELPLRKGFDERKAALSISPRKDVDGINPYNAGKLYTGEKCIIPCTPKGILKLVEYTKIDIRGKNAVVIGRSNIVGKPVSMLLLKKDATVTICHSKTGNLKDYTKNADILVAAVGRPNLISGDMIKDGAVVIDAGTTMVDGKLSGDVIFEEAYKVASWITPVPGGVGSMTTAMLAENLLEAMEL